MSKRNDQYAKLVADSFHENWAGGVPAEFAFKAAAHARRHRRLKFATTVIAGMAVLASASVFTTLRRAEGEKPVTPIQMTSPAIARGYEIISDDELLAQLRDRPLLVVTRPDGSRQIELLDTD